jgi:tetratricopeptide (TPR) repeat protein
MFILSIPDAGTSENPAHPKELTLTSKQKAEFLLSSKRYEEALEAYFKSLAEEESEDSSLFRGIVKAYEGAGKLSAAEPFIKGYLSDQPESSAAQYGLGYFYYLSGDDTRAQERFAEAPRLQAGNALAWNNWGASLSRTKSYTYAVEKVKEAIRLDSDNSMYYNNLWLIYRDMGSAGLFIADYKRYVKDGHRIVAQGYGRRIAKTLRQESFQYYAEGNLGKAIQKFEEILVIYEETGYRVGLVPIYFGLAVLHEEKGDEEMAQKYFKEVLSINPNHLQAREKVK